MNRVRASYKKISPQYQEDLKILWVRFGANPFFASEVPEIHSRRLVKYKNHGLLTNSRPEGGKRRLWKISGVIFRDCTERWGPA